MTEPRFDPRKIDIKTFSATRAQREGETPLDALPRLRDSTFPLPGDSPVAAVRWSAEGEQRTPTGGEPQPWLHVSARAEVTLECQRCLQPYTQALALDRWFRFVRNEEEAAALDEEIDEDVLVLAKQFDLESLIEDELILSLPLVPRHDECPEPLLIQEDPEVAADDVETPHPFAALAALRKKPEGE